MSRRRLLSAAAALAVAAAVLVPCMPLRGRAPDTDSGVFLYVGWRVTQGEVPYRDAWDSKPPLIYFLDAAGLALGGGSEWGVWALQWLFLAAALWLSYETLAPRVGAVPAALAAALWAAALSELLEQGNFTEQYGLTLNFAILWLAGRDEAPAARRAAAIGALTGLLFMLKQNLVALPAAWALARAWELRRAPREQGREALAGAVGFVASCGALWAWFAARGAASDLWSAAFVYNAVNTTPGLAGRWASAAAGATVTWEVLIPAGVGLGVICLRREGSRWNGSFWTACALALPLELAASSATGRAFRHYYMAWLPAAAPLAAAAAGAVFSMREHREAVAAAAVVLAAAPLNRWRAQTAQLLGRRADPVVEFLLRSTAPSDTVLVWGAGGRYNFAARRRSPGRFFIAHPLLRRGFAGPGLSAEFLADLRRDPPAAVVDLSPGDPDIPPLDARRRALWRGNGYYAVEPSLEEPLRWLESRYAPSGEVPGEAVVYRPADAAAAPRR
jgi:hypothetical protein